MKGQFWFGMLVLFGILGLGLTGARAVWADGELDSEFGADSKVTTDFGGEDYARAVANHVDGEIVAVGTSRTDDKADFLLVRYNPSGSLDTSFGTGGKVTTDFGGDDDAAAVVLQNDGNIAAGYNSPSPNGSHFAPARYRSALPRPILSPPATPTYSPTPLATSAQHFDVPSDVCASSSSCLTVDGE